METHKRIMLANLKPGQLIDHVAFECGNPIHLRCGEGTPTIGQVLLSTTYLVEGESPPKKIN